MNFDFLLEAVASVLAFFYSLPVVGGSVGVAIILLTAAVMVVLMPLTLKATRSTIKMQEMQPRLKELQKKHKDDKQTLNAELMALYQENGINPVGGCLPMLAQLPVFLVLFNVLRGLSRRVSEAPFFSISEQAREQVGGAAVVGETFEPRYLDVGSELYVDIIQQTELNFGPFDLAQEARDVIQSDVVAGIPYVVLILFVVATSFYQQRQVSSRRTGSVGMNPQQEMILKVLPLASGIWSFLFPAGLVVYWATMNVLRIGQQAFITRAYYGNQEADKADADKADADADADADDVDGTSGSSATSAGGKDEKAGTDAKGAGKAGANRSGKKSAAGKKSGAGRGGSKGGGKKPANASTGSTDESDDLADDLADDTAATNGVGANGAGSAADRAEAWAKRRRRAKMRSGSTAGQADSTSSRVTPKGTKPTSSKKKRKR